MTIRINPTKEAIRQVSLDLCWQKSDGTLQRMHSLHETYVQWRMACYEGQAGSYIADLVWGYWIPHCIDCQRLMSQKHKCFLKGGGMS